MARLQGKITVVLHWEKEHPLGQPPALQVRGHLLIMMMGVIRMMGRRRRSSQCFNYYCYFS